MRFVIVKKAAKHHDALARASMRDLQETAKSPPRDAHGAGMKGMSWGAGIGGGLGAGIGGLIHSRSAWGAGIGGGIGGGAGALIGYGVGSAKANARNREIEHAKKFTKLPKRDQAAILARDHEESERQQQIDEENWKAQQEHHRRTALMRVGGHVGSKLIRSARGEETEDDQWKDKWASHCPPCSPKAKKKILIKHHEKDLKEAVEEKDQNYAKKTVKDIEEIAADKHAAEKLAILSPGRAGLRKAMVGALRSGRPPRDWEVPRGGVGTLRRVMGAKTLSEGDAIATHEHLNRRLMQVSERSVGIPGKQHREGLGAKMKGMQMASEEGKHAAEQYADELDMIEGVDPQFLREAPVPVFDLPDLPYLSPKLAYDQDGLKIPLSMGLGEMMMKLAAKPPMGAASPFAMPGFKDGFIVLPAPTALSNAAQAAGKGTAELAHERTWKEHLSAAGTNLTAIPRVALSGEGKLTNAQKLQGALAVGLVGAAALGIHALHKKRQRAAQYDAILAKVMDDPNHQNLTDKETKVPEAYAFMRRYAPTLAMDHSIARAFVRKAVENDDHMTFAMAQLLADAESKHLEAGRPRSALKEWISHPMASMFTGKGGGGGDGKDK